jgi:hypothetical protein
MSVGLTCEKLELSCSSSDLMVFVLWIGVVRPVCESGEKGEKGKRGGYGTFVMEGRGRKGIILNLKQFISFSIFFHLCSLEVGLVPSEIAYGSCAYLIMESSTVRGPYSYFNSTNCIRSVLDGL